MIIYSSFAFFYILCITLSASSIQKQRAVLILALIILSILIASRELWPDQRVYEIAFERAPMPWEFSLTTQPFGYSEKGYLFLASIVKVFSQKTFVYLFAMGALSMYLLYKNLYKYCAIPLLGLCDYIARFLLNRDFQQMRSSLAILIIILGIDFLYKRKIWNFFFVVLLAYQFHHMSLLAIPIYFLCTVKFTKKQIVIGLILAFIISQTFAESISGIVDAMSEDLSYQTYTQGGYVNEAKGLANPMIYFQILILLVYNFFDKKIRQVTPYYDIFNAGYFYSTLILIIFCNYTALSGRTSTLFATYEIFILPLIIGGLPKSQKMIGYISIGIVLFYFFYTKYTAVQSVIGMPIIPIN